jgi:thiamine-phosphate diphosphorylase
MAIVANAEAGVRASDRATILQLRAPDLSAKDIEATANELVASSTVPVIISARSDIALATGAAGVNLPEHDVAVRDARALLDQRLIGRSVHSLEAALQAEQDGADFVIFGPVWESDSHPGSLPKGVDALAEVAHRLRIPVLAIGGVTEERIAVCHGAGAAGFAAIRLFQ